MFKFREGEKVALKTDYLELQAGTIGVIWAMYATEPPAYEVTLRGEDGQEFDATFYEDELTIPVASALVERV